MNTILTSWDQIFQALLMSLASALVGGVVLLTKQAFGFVKTKIESVKNDTIRQGLLAAESEAERLTTTIVSSLNQTIVSSIKAQNGSTLSPADAIRIKDEALTNIQTLLSDESKRILVDHKTDLIAYLGHLLEEAVGNQKSGVATLKSVI